MHPGPVMFTPDECGLLLSGGHSLYEWSYKKKKNRNLLSKNVHLVTCVSAIEYLMKLDIGCLGSPAHTGESSADCTQRFTKALRDNLQWPGWTVEETSSTVENSQQEKSSSMSLLSCSSVADMHVIDAAMCIFKKNRLVMSLVSVAQS